MCCSQIRMHESGWQYDEASIKSAPVLRSCLPSESIAKHGDVTFVPNAVDANNNNVVNYTPDQRRSTKMTHLYNYATGNELVAKHATRVQVLHINAVRA